MSNDAKFVMFVLSCAVLIISAITVGMAWSNYLFTVRQKDCISAGYEWVHLPNYADMECRKPTK